MMGRTPSPEERALWRAATRDVAPLPPGEPPPPPAEPAPLLKEKKEKAPAARPKRVPKPAAAPVLPALAPARAPGLDARSADRLRRGEKPIEARLDLHGMTQAEAHRVLDDFLARCHKAEKRCVLVITGKGGRDGQGGVLRASVPRWLNEAPNRARILAFAPAQPRDGGAGALYLLLKRRR